MNDFATATDAVANIVIAFTAASALWIAWRQVNLSRELSALEAYENYHTVCLQYPQFASGDVDFGNLSLRDLRQYEMFVLYTLMMDERIHALFPRDPAWRFSICDDIRMHRAFISSETFKPHLDKQGWQIKSLIDEVLAEPEN